MEITQTLSSNKEIIFERDIIRVPFNTEDERDLQIYNIIKTLNERVDKLQKEKDGFCQLTVSKEEAKKRVIKFLKYTKSEGNEQVSLFEISSELKLPALQVEEVLEEIKDDGLIKEIE